MRDTTIHYWLATTAVHFTGACTTTVPAHGGQATRAANAQAELLTRADRPSGAIALTISEKLAESQKFSLTFTDDGRLAGSDATNIGQGSVVLGAIASLAGQVIGAATGLKALLVAGSEESKPEFGEQQLLTDLIKRENDLACELLTPTDSTPFATIGKALKLVAAQRDRLETAKAAWAAGTDTNEAFDYTLDVAQLPTEQELRNGIDITRHPEASKIWQQSGIMATVNVSPASRNMDSELGSEAEVVSEFSSSAQAWYRLPRPATITVWTVDLNDDSATPQPVRTSAVALLDKNSRHMPLPVAEDSIFGQHEVSVTMGASGTPVAYGADTHSGVSDAATALAAITSGFGGGVTDLAAARTGLAGLAPAGPPSEIAALTTEKQTLELKAAIAKLKKSG